MTINVQSNDPKSDALVNQPAKVEAEVSKDETTSAPEAKAPEQKESSESETVETEEQDSESSESDALKEGESDAKEEKDESGKPHKKSGFQRRVDKLNQRISAEAQEKEYWKQQALQGASGSKAESKVETKAAEPEGKPDPTKFDTHEAYDEAKYQWRRKQEKAEEERSKLQSEQTKTVQSYVERRDAFSKQNADFDEVISEVDDIPVSAAIRDIILTSENGPQIAYELAKNREEYARVCKLPPLAAAREIGKLESRLALNSSAGKTTETKKVSTAPKPLAPVGGGGKASAPPKNLDEAARSSFADFKRAREEQLKTKRRRA